MKDFLRNYFGFSKKELNGILVLFVLIITVLFFPSVYKLFYKEEQFDFSQFKRDVEDFKASAQAEGGKHNYKQLKDEIEDKELKATYFDFDPNGLPEADWKKLGLSEKQIKGIKNYEAKGGKFYTKDDVKKMYTISAAQYARLEPYITIKPGTTKEYKPDNDFKEFKKEETNYKNKPVVIIELNTADSAKLESIKGIGPAFASRIIKYRTRLGGFYSKEQLREVFGIDSTKYEQLKDLVSVNAQSIKKININTILFDDIKRNPYLTFKQMNAIIQYRKQNGNYTSADDLKKVALLNAEIIRKIEPYLNFNH
ncbi:MAG: helix-hairpin-helix domain-containing protein [Daejeonella sp.]